MKEFVYGTEKQFAKMDEVLSAGTYLKFAGRTLTEKCRPASATLWFARKDGRYELYIDKGIETEETDAGFRQLLENGYLSFASMEEMSGFLHSLQPLFAEPEPVADFERLKKLREQKPAAEVIMPDALQDRLARTIIGQDDALSALARKVSGWWASGRKKVLVISMLGPTGTGKTATARALASALSALSGAEYGTIQVAANQMTDEISVARFFGAPPGYIGYGQKTIFEDVRKNPDQVLILDEIEKAHPNVLSGLMEAFDKGVLEMADNSEPISLNRCIILLTSNLPVDAGSALSAFEQDEICRNALTAYTGKPEIAARIQGYLVYRPLDDEAMARIIAQYAVDVLASYDMKLVRMDEEVLDELIDEAQKSSYGIRAAQNLVKDVIDRTVFTANTVRQLRNQRVVMKGTLGNLQITAEERKDNGKKLYA